MDRLKKSRVWLIVLIVVLLSCLCATCLATILLYANVASPPLGIFSSSKGDLPEPVQSQPSSTLRSAGGTLRLVGGDFITLDPALIEDSTSSADADKVFVGLVSLDKALQVRPELAETWEVSEDGTVYTFQIREDARFQDGRPITAADVKYSIERACDPQVGSGVAALYLGDIVGAEEKLAGDADGVAGVEVLDERAIRLTIDAPKAYFLSKLTYSTAAIVDKDNVEAGSDWFENPNGSGPYRLARHTGDEIILQASDYYFRGKPAIERLHFNLAPADPTTMYETGELDVAPVGLDAFERVQDPYNPLHDELVEVPALNVQYVGFNTHLAPFDDVRVRQAFAMATNRKALAQVLFKGSVREARGILPPGLPGYQEGFEGLAYSPARARERLAASEYPSADDLPPIRLATSFGSTDIAEALAMMYRDALDIEIEIEQVDWADFLADLGQGRYQMFILGWSADYPDPQDFLDIQFHSRSSANHTGYANPRVDELLEAARVEQDADQRMALYGQAEAIVVSEAPWTPLTHGVEYLLVKPYVKGLSITPQGVYYLEEAYLEPD